MKIVGIHWTLGNNNEKLSTLHVLDEFSPYYSDADGQKRGCIGKKSDSIYVGAFDISNLTIGNEIEIFFDKAVTTSRGTFQPIKKIEIVEKK